MQTKLLTEGTVCSSLEIAHTFKKEEFMFKTITDKAPIFRFKTFRCDPNISEIKAELQDPSLKVGFNRKHDKYTFDFDTEYNHQSSEYNLQLAFAYNAVKNFSFGIKTEFAGTVPDVAVQPCDYNVAVSYQRNEDQTFSIETLCALILAHFIF